MKQDKDIKLVKCTNCKRAFYFKTTSRHAFELVCPYCEKEVTVEINGSIKNDSPQSKKS